MKRIITLGWVALAVATLAPPLYARDENFGGKGGGGGRAAVSAPRAAAPAPAMRSAPSMARAHVAAPAPTRVAPIQPNRAAQFEQSRIASQQAVARNNAVARSNAVARNNARVAQPSVAFGGTGRGDFRDRNISTRGNFRAPSEDVWRGWDRNRVHTWNNHHWGWRNNGWVVIDSGPYYGWGYGAPYDYYDEGPDVTYAPTYNESYGSITADVQSRLAAQGYNPGPVDGVAGAQTGDAIADFQADHGLPTTGRIDNALLKTLGL